MQHFVAMENNEIESNYPVYAAKTIPDSLGFGMLKCPSLSVTYLA